MNPGPEDGALDCPWKGLLVLSGVEALNLGVSTQNKVLAFGSPKNMKCVGEKGCPSILISDS